MVKHAILDINQGIYLVKLNAVSRKQLINQNLDAFELWSLLIDLSYRLKVGVIGYCLTEKSLILLYQAPASPEPFIQSLITQYSSWHNRTHQKRGSLFQADYQLVLIEPGKHLLEAFHLVHAFPVIDDLTSKSENYALSSYKEYAQNLSHTWLSTDIVTPLIGRHDTMFSRRFKDFIDQAVTYDIERLLTGNQSNSLAYCSDQYLKELYEQPTALPNGISIEEVIEFVCALYQFKPIQLQTLRRHRLMPELKGMIAFLCQEYEIADSDEVMSVLNLDDFDYERNLKLIEFLSDTEMYARKQSFEQLLFKLNHNPTQQQTMDDELLSDHPDNVHILNASPIHAESSDHLNESLESDNEASTDTTKPTDSSSQVI
ncbi:hypothetical protein [Litoribrevibacter albus]|uniref:Uncharacterized protein n=1 Tax=Litoribrevibacter albus TaxID=1473156 RepID=A0AA37S6N9_9GAMM|nr:hypothetical protein [Litoribrevibacter albus]GLQ29705.1 hypothetical protein GCM10007876_01830 [Litoribrevibacter albus]